MSLLVRRQTFRLAFGMTLSSALAFGIAWPLSYLTPLLAAKLLTTPRTLRPKEQIGFLVILWVALTAGTELLLPLLQYPAVHLLATGLILFLLFYLKAGGVNPIIVVLMLIAVVTVPLIGTIQPALARAVSQGLVFCAVVAVATVYVSTALFPDPPDAPPPPKATASEGGDRTSKERAVLALRSLVVLYPLVVLFQLYSAVGAAVMLVFAMLLSLEPTYGVHLRAGTGLLLGHFLGGLVALALYQLLVFVPAYVFFLLLCLLSGLLIGQQVFRGTPTGKLLSAGLASVFVVLGPTLTSDETAGSTLVLRLALISAAVVYVVLAFGLLQRLTHGRRSYA